VRIKLPSGTAEDRCAPTCHSRRDDTIAGSTTPPLQWWRRLRADAFTAEHIRILSRAFAGIGMIGEPRWPDAVRGHAASAVAVALGAVKASRELTPNIDLAMSTVLVPAIVGDTAAITVLVTMIERFEEDADKKELIRSWLTRLHKRGHGA
jgi:hypothetical protein